MYNQVICLDVLQILQNFFFGLQSYLLNFISLFPMFVTILFLTLLFYLFIFCGGLMVLDFQPEPVISSEPGSRGSQDFQDLVYAMAVGI